MKITISTASLAVLKTDLHILPITEENCAEALASAVALYGVSVHRIGADFEGKSGQVTLIYPDQSHTKRLLLLGLGQADNIDQERMRRAMAHTTGAIRSAQTTHISLHISLSLPPVSLPTQDLAQSIIEGLELSLYQFNVYKTDPKLVAQKVLNAITLHVEAETAAAKKGADRGQKIVDAVCLARDLVNTTPNDQTATMLAKGAQKTLEKVGVSVSVWDKARIKKEKMGGLLAVNLGSNEPPSFTIMKWEPKKAVNPKPIVLVGKGVVFDTGGLSLKPTLNSMDHMKCDMAGAAAVIATMQAVATLKLPLNVIALVPATDNRPGENAYVPGDVITMHSGKTVEVLNTDAEGRMILADALSYAQKFAPELVVDLATLTGAQVVALGNFVAGMMTNEDEGASERLAQFQAAATRSGDWVAPLPMFDEYAELIKSKVADLKNVGGSGAGTITAGKFLEAFTDYPWVHLDIAGPAFIDAPRHYQPAGGTGFGVKLLVEFLSQRAQLPKTETK